MKLLFINYQALPIPAVKGGAVEYLVDSFLKYNEIHNLHDITLYSIYDKQAESESLDYKKTKFRFIKIQSVWDKCKRAVRHLINKHTPFYIGNAYICKIINEIKNFNEFDKIIIENAPDFGLKIREKYRGTLILHLHNDYLNKKTKNARKIFDCYDKIYTISSTLGDIVREIKASDKVKTLYNGINPEDFKKNGKRDEIRNKYKIKKDDFVFMYSGRITSDKGVYHLAKAFSEIDNDKLKLVIAGETKNNKLVNKIKEIKDKRIIFTGFIPYHNMNDIYQMADVGVIPSVCRDAFNLTVIEYASNGIPLIISDRGAMKELVNENCSIIVKYDPEGFSDNIKKALLTIANKDIADMGQQAKKISEKFTIEGYCKLFNELLENSCNH